VDGGERDVNDRQMRKNGMRAKNSRREQKVVLLQREPDLVFVFDIDVDVIVVTPRGVVSAGNTEENAESVFEDSDCSTVEAGDGTGEFHVSDVGAGFLAWTDCWAETLHIDVILIGECCILMDSNPDRVDSNINLQLRQSCGIVLLSPSVVC